MGRELVVEAHVALVASSVNFSLIRRFFDGAPRLRNMGARREVAASQKGFEVDEVTIQLLSVEVDDANLSHARGVHQLAPETK